ncbi:GLPGLI family protein [Chryseobacterium wangxinyae]|uniref:GLPGLI family protein n=1 Tax=Chryseobacterium sp. CY350 TaxID=2997336 RepID=UPI0022715DC2|nr:GLPGLI family protein [Chryseobacterium sp. CY350]MCY0976129.1 GLPGLI family protein [Chryseobacterium sp. CY350]WBZ94271.1 GLPGLI family protein [Chryseobacterium sp. CY350]
MRNITIILILFTLFSKSFAQIKISGQYIAHYRATMVLGKNNLKNENFTFIFGNSSSYFASDINYQSENSGEFGFGSYFPERFIFSDEKYHVSGKYVETSISYEERVVYKWKIEGQKKFVNGVYCQLATTVKYGRKWNAYFAKEYPFQLGPAKFGGLPGLIFEISDSTGEYKFVLEDLKKQDISLKINLENYKKLTKSDYLKARNNSEFSIASFPGMPIQQTREFEKKLEKLKEMNNNPLELKPFE